VVLVAVARVMVLKVLILFLILSHLQVVDMVVKADTLEDLEQMAVMVVQAEAVAEMPGQVELALLVKDIMVEIIEVAAVALAALVQVLILIILQIKVVLEKPTTFLVHL
jgi:hypothetical protein